jgi:hypothetical protein
VRVDALLAAIGLGVIAGGGIIVVDALIIRKLRRDRQRSREVDQWTRR